MEIIRIAIPKGNASVTTLFRNVGYPLPDDFGESRKYIVPVKDTNLEFILAKPIDIPTYVEYGAADVGIMGKEFLLEENRDVYELLDLEISVGSLSIIGRSNKIISNPKVATTYPNIASSYYHGKGQQVDVIKFSGGTELALFTGLADYIVELTGNLLLNFRLVEIEKICNISCRLIANRVSYQLKNKGIQRIYEELRNC